MGELGYLQKRGYNDHHKYNYATEADVSEAVRALLVKHGVLFIPNVVPESVSRVNGTTSLLVECVFINAEQPSDRLAVVMAGDGWDKGDKGPYKAVTGAVKYALMKTFLIPTGDDPERATEADREEVNPVANAKAKAASTTLPGKINSIKVIAKAVGSKPEDICRFYKVESIDQLSEKQADECLAALTKKGETK